MKRCFQVGFVVLVVLALTAGAVPAQVQKNSGHMPPHRGQSVAYKSKVTTYLGYRAAVMAEGLYYPDAIAVSSRGDSIYFGEGGSGDIFRLLNQKIASTPVSFDDVEVARLRNAFYVGDDYGEIYKLGPAGKYQHQASTPAPFDVYVSGLDIDPVSGAIYYVVNSWDDYESALFKLPAGSDTPIYLDSWEEDPSWGLAVKGKYLYVTDYYSDSLWSFSLESGDWEEIVTGLGGPTDICFDKLGNLFVAGYSDGTIYRIKAGTWAVSTIADGLYEPFRLQLDASNRIYFTDYGAGIIWKLFK